MKRKKKKKKATKYQTAVSNIFGALSLRRMKENYIKKKDPTAAGRSAIVVR